MAFDTGIFGQSSVKRNPGGVFRKQFARHAPDTDIIRLVTAQASSRRCPAERSVAAQATPAESMMPFRERTGVEHEFGIGQRQDCQQDRYSDEYEDRFHQLPPVQEKSYGQYV